MKTPGIRIFPYVLFGALSLSACTLRNHPTVPPINPVLPPVPVDIALSIENSQYMGAYFDLLNKTMSAFLQDLSSSSVPFQLSLFRSTENQDGNYDSRAQGPTPVIASTDKDVAGELSADLQAMRSAYQGQSPLPLDILDRAAADPRVSVDPSRHKLLLTLNSADAGKYQQPGANAQDFWNHFQKEFDWYYQKGNWHYLPLQAAPVPKSTSFLPWFSWSCNQPFADSVSGGSDFLTLDQDFGQLATAIAQWH